MLPAQAKGPRGGWIRRVPVVAVLLLLVAGSATAWYAADVDGDGLATRQELAWGLDPSAGDSDHDGLTDGWEATHGSDPRLADSDRDGLPDLNETALGTSLVATDSDDDGVPDATEVAAGTNPLDADSDGDGIPDGDEFLTDCGHDGIPAALQLDDDADGRIDAAEPTEQRCNADSDGDGVLDGHEQSVLCITVKDCDGDGLDDASEVGAFSPLVGDSLGSGLGDAVGKAFADQGSTPGTDADDDGIPDSWETATPPVSWQGLQPQAGRKDLLVEFVRLQGPDSRRYAGPSSFAPAYAEVAALFAQGGITVSWTETALDLPSDLMGPDGLPAGDAYFTYVYDHARLAANPYVNTVVLSPHLNQATVGHSGIGQIRGMLTAVDYSDAFQATATSSKGDSFTMRVSQEADPGNQLANSGNPPTLRVTGSDWGGAYATWQGYWFHTSPVLRFPSGTTRTMTVSVQLDTAWLAHVIAHELGHNLGLCHAMDAACYSAFTAADQAARDASTMSYNSGTALHFLASEWSTIDRFLACPPTGTLQAIAQKAPTSQVYTAKYVDPQGRECVAFRTLTADLQPVATPASSYQAPAPQATDFLPQAGSANAFYLGAALATLLGTLAWALFRRRALAAAIAKS